MRWGGGGGGGRLLSVLAWTGVNFVYHVQKKNSKQE